MQHSDGTGYVYFATRHFVHCIIEKIKMLYVSPNRISFISDMNSLENIKSSYFEVKTDSSREKMSLVRQNV